MAQQIGENTKVTLDLKTIGIIIGGAISLGIGIIFILRLVADATTTSVITAKLPITIAEVLIATI